MRPLSRRLPALRSGRLRHSRSHTRLAAYLQTRGPVRRQMRSLRTPEQPLNRVASALACSVAAVFSGVFSATVTSVGLPQARTKSCSFKHWLSSGPSASDLAGYLFFLHVRFGSLA